MAPQRLRHIKREIRVLGIAAGHSVGGFTIIGVVYRGSLWLDGVLRGYSEDCDLTQGIIDMICGSPHSGQIRVILLSQANMPSEVTISREQLYFKTGKPVIFLGEPGAAMFKWKNSGDKVAFSAEGIGRWSAESVLVASTREGDPPEALRVAALILSALTGQCDA